MARNFDAADWHAASGAGAPFDWHVVRTLPADRGGLRTEHMWNKNETAVRRFKTREAAERAAEKLQRTADLDNARESARLAVYHLIRATDHLSPGHPLVAIAVNAGDIYLALVGQKL